MQKGNLLSRTDNSKTETFSYDNMNRLTSAAGKVITYAANGNITRIEGVESMTYGNTAMPYQVTMLSPEGTAVPLRNQSVSYTSFQRPSRVEENGLSASFTYNAAGDRVKMYVANGTTPVLTRYYIGGQCLQYRKAVPWWGRLFGTGSLRKGSGELENLLYLS